MITLELAQQLKAAGLTWQPALHDFFAIPDIGLDDRVFVISDMVAEVEVMRGWPTITFHGSVEWALDYVLQMDAVWLPTETQLRNLLLDAIGRSGSLTIVTTTDKTLCTVTNNDVAVNFHADNVCDAYAHALLAGLR